MPNFRTGNMLNHLSECDYACITTNSFVKKDGKLVMGRGIARQVRDSFPDIDLDFGHEINKRYANLAEYLILDSNYYPKILAFQVKYHWADKADVDLIAKSAAQLSVRATENPDKTFFLNFPGIGNGQLSISDVEFIVNLLPENVTVWTL